MISHQIFWESMNSLDICVLIFPTNTPLLPHFSALTTSSFTFVIFILLITILTSFLQIINIYAFCGAGCLHDS